ncbi:hypothetical protein POTOM_006033 [Populus tomentosa]|uniref:CCHC-type domain-containing protein n=1 Tax=Populus tomentosa TaxID=118781 RepID=A0A8X8AKB4_POPTO|nr:hypothetical protein POTOM_006033 [Populus tomentosa]
MQSRLKSAWKLSGGFELMDIGNGYFMVKFDIAEDRERVINGGPWMIFDYYLTMQKWTADFVASSVLINRTMVWVRVPSLNLVFYDENFLPAMASALGTPFKVDMNTLNVERGRFARICIEIDLDQPAVGRIWIRDHWYKVEYEGLHIICSKCGCYGHFGKDCLAKGSTQDDLPRTESAEHLTTAASGDRTSMAVEERAKVMGNALAINSACSYDRLEILGGWLIVNKRRKPETVNNVKPKETNTRFHSNKLKIL